MSWKQFAEEVGSLMNLTVGGIIPMEKGCEELNKILKEKNFPEISKEEFIKRFTPKPQQIKISPEQMKELADKAEKVKKEGEK